LFEQFVAVPVQKRRFTLGVFEFMSGVSPAASGAPNTGQQHAQSQHPHRADHDPEQEQRARRPGDVIAEHGEVLRQRMSGPRIGQHTGEPDNHRGKQNNKSNDDDHVDTSDLVLELQYTRCALGMP
jgi:hypothetical protein